MQIEAIVAAILASLCFMVLMLGGILVFVVYTFNGFAQAQVEETRKFTEKLLLIHKAPTVIDAVNAASTLEHNREALRQGQMTFEHQLSKNNEEDNDRPEPVVVEDQLTGHKIEVII